MNIHKLKDSGACYDEASEWLARLDRGLTSTEHNALEQWLLADPEHLAVLSAMAKLWDKMDTLSRLAYIVPHQKPKRAAGPHWLAMAAALLVVMVSAGAWFLQSSSVPDEVASTVSTGGGAGVYETAVGQQSKVELADGTVVSINTNSRVQVRYGNTERLLFLDRGEIHITVAHDTARPLTVFAGDRMVQALGTAFSVKFDDSSTIELVVTDGRVKVGVRPPRSNTSASAEAEASAMAVNAEAMLVERGERIMLGASNEQIELVTPEDIEVELSWREGNLVFRGESLDAVAIEIGRYTPVEFVIMDEDLKKVRVAGLFKASDVKGFLATLEANFNIDHERLEGDRVLLRPHTLVVPKAP